ncbi:uncharacterized protein EV154DRAFT_507682 [Mucor mucedo]|uniref:uncharacterized protein n=1 Tax=Mucor mucedo TaxID=29922 RepID=UPI002220E21B|nr:uncharacterized protein EV154DRAFT_507682 [Mucor mucedo]KAI7891528.1 hypothetical protein EV154DRAFT_507682 [Mucor mucedo]
MTNNIFVPQTFNGERMVNVNLPNRRVGSQPVNDNTTNSPSTSLSIATTAAVAATRLRAAPANAAAAAAASATGSAPASNSGPTATAAENTSPSPKHIMKPQASPPSATQFIISTPIDSPSYKHEEGYVQKYWSEANIAILIQLHRKYYNGISSEDPKQSVDSWIQLTKEYNSITHDDRSKHVLMRRWGKVMRKYNAERSCLVVQQQKSASAASQQMPMVSYWNHFQYMDGYLSHLSIPEDSLYSKKRDDDSDYDEVIVETRKRQHNGEEPITDDKLRWLEKQRLVMEQTLQKQQVQIDMMKKNYDSMNKMNMKFVDMCEKVTSKNQTNESRYLDLLEKYMDDKLLEKKEHDSQPE